MLRSCQIARSITWFPLAMGRTVACLGFISSSRLSGCLGAPCRWGLQLCHGNVLIQGLHSSCPMRRSLLQKPFLPGNEFQFDFSPIGWLQVSPFCRMFVPLDHCWCAWRTPRLNLLSWFILTISRWNVLGTATVFSCSHLWLFTRWLFSFVCRFLNTVSSQCLKPVIREVDNFARMY